MNAIQKRLILEGRGTYPLNVQGLRFLSRAVAYRKVLFVFAKILCSVIQMIAENAFNLQNNNPFKKLFLLWNKFAHFFFCC